MSALPKALLALLLLLPGGFVVAPLVLLGLRWYAKRETRQEQSAPTAPSSQPAPAIHVA